MQQYIKQVLDNMPSDWLHLTTHRLDIYDEAQAKVAFLSGLESLYASGNASSEGLAELPTAFDYIRLGHPLSCLLEWILAKEWQLAPEGVISFSSQTAPILAVLRKNSFEKKPTLIAHDGALPHFFDAEIVKTIYQYEFEILEVASPSEIPKTAATTLFVSAGNWQQQPDFTTTIDFFVTVHPDLGSILMVNGDGNLSYVSEIQHVRRRETIAMTPSNCLTALQQFLGNEGAVPVAAISEASEQKVATTIKSITGTHHQPLIGSSGLSIQYAIMMGLIHDAVATYPQKNIAFIVPPNCYGGTNDQARRVAACLSTVSIMDLPVDGNNNMVASIDRVLETAAHQDVVPYIIAEIPTNPRVEVPDLEALHAVLAKSRITAGGQPAVAPVFILDQTFCPNVPFLGDNQLFSGIKAISYVSGSKFPSGGKCTAGYCVSNGPASYLLPKIAQHLTLCDNRATAHQVAILGQQMPSMLERISGAYSNTRAFVQFIESTLPTAKINFVSEALAERGFTPSVFSLDLPTKGTTHEEKEAYKRLLNDRLIHMMITEIPNESKFCVSYGQLKGCYWTIPATSTQGTTKESDKDYIVRVAVSPDLDLERHKAVFKDFVATLEA